MVNTFVFMGRPGSGKDVQAEFLSNKLGCKVYSIGGRLREIARQDSKFGHKVSETIDSGDLTPVWLASYLFQEVILNLDDNENAVMHGVGRREPEARLFSEVCNWIDRDFIIINLEVSEKTVIERLNKRSKVEKRGDDDDVQNRFNEFNKHTVPALNFFRSIGKVIDIDGEPVEEVVAAEVWQKIQGQ
jgi:adenylate kinase family enzyme